MAAKSATLAEVMRLHTFYEGGLRSVAKQALPNMADELITQDKTLILDVGSTTRELAQFLKKCKSLTVITQSLEYVMHLAKIPLLR